MAPEALKKRPVAISCLAFAVAYLVAGALLLTVDNSEGTYFLVTVLGAVLGFPSVWLTQEIVWGLEETIAGRTVTPFTVIVAIGMLINWALIGIGAQAVWNRVRESEAPRDGLIPE